MACLGTLLYNSFFKQGLVDVTPGWVLAADFASLLLPPSKRL